MNMNTWRSIDELEDKPGFRDWLQREFPPLASEWTTAPSRRSFLKIMGASFALAGLNACTRQPLEKIVPYVKQPEDLVPGQPLYFATALNLDGYARGVLVESHEGRPTKIEGNPEHPASLGASDIFMQAEILTLYDPDRSKSVMNGLELATWDGFLALVAREREKWKLNGGAGLRLLTGHTTSPTLLSQMEKLLKDFPNAKWHTYEPLAPVVPQPFYDVAKAEVILAIEDDFLGPGPAQLKYARDFASRRRANSGTTHFNRLYVAESTPTITGARADHRFALGLRALQEFANALTTGAALPDWSVQVIADIKKNAGKSLMLVGDSLPEEAREFARNWNQPLQIAEPLPSNGNSLGELISEIDTGKIETLVILGGNPAYDAPVDFNFVEKLARVPLRIRLGLYEDETSALCQWHIAEAHALETWSDTRAFDGTATIMQPLIEPLYGGKSAHEMIAALTGNEVASGYEIVRQYWLTQQAGNDFEKYWRKSLHDGVVEGTAASKPSQFVPRHGAAVSGSGLELVFRPSPSTRDGRFANNAWLQ